MGQYEKDARLVARLITARPGIGIFDVAIGTEVRQASLRLADGPSPAEEIEYELGELGPADRMLIHNIVAHPMLELAPTLGRWLHDLTVPADEPAPAETTCAHPGGCYNAPVEGSSFCAGRLTARRPTQAEVDAISGSAYAFRAEDVGESWPAPADVPIVNAGTTIESVTDDPAAKAVLGIIDQAVAAIGYDHPRELVASLRERAARWLVTHPAPERMPASSEDLRARAEAARP